MNSVTALPAAKTVTPANAANRISQFGNASYNFDNHGQTTSKTDATGTTNYQWDAQGRLTKATLPNGNSVDYGFDALGRRASRSYQGNTTNFLYDGADVVADKNGASVTTDYLNGAGIDDKLRQTSNLGNLYFVQDHSGSTNALTSATGGVIERLTYEAFGNHNPSALTRYTYTGREDDSATGLMYYRARWYDSQQGRFVTEDPIGIQGGLNLYAYVGNVPISKVDPFGLNPLLKEVVKKGGKAAASNALAYIIAQKVKGEPVTMSGLIISGATGFMGGVVGSNAGYSKKIIVAAVSNLAEESLQAYDNCESFGLSEAADALAKGAGGAFLGDKVGNKVATKVHGPTAEFVGDLAGDLYENGPDAPGFRLGEGGLGTGEFPHRPTYVQKKIKSTLDSIMPTGWL